VRRYVQEWTVRIEDQTDLARAIHARHPADDRQGALALLPKERVYKVAIPD
jgi:hypothetical protein